MNGGEATSNVAVTKGDFPAPLGALPTPAVPVDIEILWPAPARWTIASLLFVAALLIGWNSWLRLPEAARPSEMTAIARGARPDEAAQLFRIDLNKADHAQLLQIPGVGESLARRIESYRESKGGFRDISELANVSGIGPAILARLKPHLMVGDQPIERVVEVQPRSTPAVRKSVDPAKPVNVNSAALAELQRLPGIGPTIAARIVAAREEKPFRAVADLRRVSGIGVKTLEKLRPFVVVEDVPKPER